MAGSLLAVALFAALSPRPTKGQALPILGCTPFVGSLLPARLRLTVVQPAHGLAAGVSGPVLAVFLVHSGLGRRAIVATKATVQTSSHALEIAYFGTLLSAG